MLKRLAAVAAILIASGAAASAAPLESPISPPPRIILAAGGCGYAFHRTPYGDCVPFGGGYYGRPVFRRPPPPCPPGYYRDPDPARPLCYLR